MRGLICFKVGVFVLVSMGIISNSLGQDFGSKSRLSHIPEVWSEVDPAEIYPDFEYNGLAPACSGCPTCTSDKFTFFVKGGTTNKLVIYFQGGGACWDSMNCLYNPTYSQQQIETIEMFKDTSYLGIFDTNNLLNPFKEWNFVYIPYCTGDIHWGANDMVYPDYLDEIPDVDTWTIQHRGFVNFQVILKWIVDNFTSPQQIFVTGVSAGSYGAIMGFPYIKEAFPDSRVYVLGDSGNGVTGGEFQDYAINNWDPQLPNWIPGFEDGYSSNLSMGDAYKNIAEYYPSCKIAQFTTAWDNNQAFFYNVMLNIDDPELWEDITPVWCDWHEQMLDYAYYAAGAPNYRYYIAARDYHTIMMSPLFYIERSAGVSFVGWVRAMVMNPFGVSGGLLGGRWKNLECQECKDPVPCP